jgi:NADPH:quinone reductase-like Zn-dependent oxidoreductase
MRAVIIRKYGGPEVLEHVDLPEPKVTDGHVLIKLEAGAVNPIDWRIRKGEMKMFVRAPFPIILGAELSGEITEVGPGVTRFKRGDKVFALIPGDHGGFAEIVSVPEQAVCLRPKNVDAILAAAIPVGALTALQSLRDKGELKAGQRVLINGASGAVGLFAVQIARELGAAVTGVCSGSKFESVKAAGANECLDYGKDDYAKLGKKWDVIFDAAGKRHFKDSHDALEHHGIFVTTIGGGGDMIAPVLNPLRAQKARFIIAKPNATDLEYIRDLVEGGKLKPNVGTVLPMSKVAEAHALSESGKATGKIVLTP